MTDLKFSDEFTDHFFTAVKFGYFNVTWIDGEPVFEMTERGKSAWFGTFTAPDAPANSYRQAEPVHLSGSQCGGINHCEEYTDANGIRKGECRWNAGL